jgi:hypothetical protein
MPPAREPSPDRAAAVNADNADDRSDFSTTDDDNTAHEFFSHRPLDLHEASIRLIQVQKVLSVDEGLIQCSIEQATTSASYSCLSYRWGNPSHHHYSIRINGKRFAVRENLFNYLEVLRAGLSPMSTQSEPMWIDALCIDQDNPQERNHQVAQMGDIYSRAKCVFVWLGKIPRPETQSITSLVRMKTVLYHDEECPDRYIPQQNRVNANVITQNEYWNRTWIIQEVILARRVEVVLHDRTVYLSDFLFEVGKCDNGTYKHFYSLFNYNAGLKSQSLLSTRRKIRLQQSSGSDLCDRIDADKLLRQIYLDHRLIILLYRFRGMKCENPYDRIFSLLSISEEGRKVQVDYSKPATEVAFQVLTCCERTLCVCSAALVAATLKLGDATSLHRDGTTPFLEFKLPMERWRYYLYLWGYGTKGKMSKLSKREICPALRLVVQHLGDGLLSAQDHSQSAHPCPLQYSFRGHTKAPRNDNKDVERDPTATFPQSLSSSVSQDKCLEAEGFSSNSTNLDGYITIRLSLELLGACFKKKQNKKALELCDFATHEDSTKQKTLLQSMRLGCVSNKLRTLRDPLHQPNPANLAIRLGGGSSLDLSAAE